MYLEAQLVRQGGVVTAGSDKGKEKHLGQYLL
jgi:hypothetical protein